MTCRSEIRMALDHLEWCAQQWEAHGTPARWRLLEAARAAVEHAITTALARHAGASMTITQGGQWR